MKVFFQSLLVFTAMAAQLTAATKEAETRGTAFFETKIRPLLVQHCYKCHSEAQGEKKAGLLLDRQSGWLDGGDSGQTIVPGDVEGSLFIKAIRYADEDMQMPPKYQLDAEVVTLLEQWVKMGAPGPKQDMGETAFSKLGDQDILFEKAKTHWAFQPVKAVEPPKSGDAAWDAHPVDRFILAKMKEKGLEPSKQAEVAVLQRRLAYDLTGLPPAKEAGTDVKAEIERLIESPHFGEHFARMWLDVARYADTANVTVPAARTETYYPFAFTFRDYVIESFNQDKPYDVFIKEQLAADLMGFKDRSPEQAALGFIAVTPFTQAPHDFVDDVIDTTTRGFLGLTVACARCHDHKFEPVPTADYYSLYGVFGSIDRVKHSDFGKFPVIDGYEPSAELRDDYQKKREVILAKVDAAKKSGKLLGGKRPQWQIILQSDMCELITFHDGAGSRAIIVTENEKPMTPRIFLRGEADTRGDAVPRRFLKLLDPMQAPFPETNSGRLALAEKIASTDNPLTARVMVNRVWGFLMGSYLVDTPSDFGLQGAAPTHPELLDWLAVDFMAQGWSLKHLVRTIVSSRTYQQGSAVRADMAERDPTNEWLWRANAKRLSIEQIRDTLLALSGTLDPRLKGHSKPMWDVESNPRRSIYGLINRINTDPTLRAFDFPSTSATADRRTDNIVPQQSLFTLNSPFLIAKAQALVESLQLSNGMSTSDRVNAVFQRIHRRDATPKEQERMIPFLALMEKRKQDPWPLVAQSLLTSNETLYLD
jgi:hypothetical protein